LRLVLLLQLGVLLLVLDNLVDFPVARLNLALLKFCVDLLVEHEVREADYSPPEHFAGLFVQLNREVVNDRR